LILFLIIGILCFILTPVFAISFAKNWQMYRIIMGMGFLLFYICVFVIYFNYQKKRGDDGR